jgi:hypothetical protein
LTVAVSRLLVLPLRELYAVLWRAGVVRIVDKPAAASSQEPTSDEFLANSGGATVAVAARAAVPGA